MNSYIIISIKNLAAPMKKISLLILASLFLIGTVQAQEEEFRQLLSMQNKSAMEKFEESENDTPEEALGPLLHFGIGGKRSPSLKCPLRRKTHAIRIVIHGGYNFHVADYPDGTCVVSCLDGPEKGLQGIAFRGDMIAETRNVEWHECYFVHFYPAGKITSYQHKQVAEVY